MRQACGALLSCPRVRCSPARRRRPAAVLVVRRSIAVVSASGGQYTDPSAAVANVSQGDAWCRSAGDDPARFPCVISIAPGVYELASTLIVPAHVAVIGYGPATTVLTAGAGVAVTVQLGIAGLDPVFSSIALRDLTVENRFGAGGFSVALGIVKLGSLTSTTFAQPRRAGARNLCHRHESNSRGSFNRLDATATGGSTSTGFKVVNRGSPRMDQCSIRASEASTRNVGVETTVGRRLRAARSLQRKV